MSAKVSIAIAAFALFASMHCALLPSVGAEGQKNNLPAPGVPVYQEQLGQSGANHPGVDSYVPHATFPYADTYPNSGYDNYLLPFTNAIYPQATATMPFAAQSALQLALRLFAKVGLFLVGGVALLVVGGIFTKLVCSVVPICTLTFAGMQDFDKDSMRSFVTPDKISQAADFVHEAIGKYQRLQRAIGN